MMMMMMTIMMVVVAMAMVTMMMLVMVMVIMVVVVIVSGVQHRRPIGDNTQEASATEKASARGTQQTRAILNNDKVNRTWA